MSGVWLVLALAGWPLFVAALVACHLASNRAREAQARERVQAAAAAEAVEEARLMEQDAQRWRDRAGGDRRIRQQFARIAEAVLSDMPDVAEQIEQLYIEPDVVDGMWWR